MVGALEAVFTRSSTFWQCSVGQLVVELVGVIIVGSECYPSAVSYVTDLRVVRSVINMARFTQSH